MKLSNHLLKLIGSAFMFSLRHFGGVMSLGGLKTALHLGVWAATWPWGR